MASNYCRCCCKINGIVVLIGLVAGLLELIAACVVNFHTFGFIAGLLCMGISISIIFKFVCYSNAEVWDMRQGTLYSWKESAEPIPVSVLPGQTPKQTEPETFEPQEKKMSLND